MILKVPLGRYAIAVEKSEGANCTLKDLDFKHSLALDLHAHGILRAQLETDCSWLKLLGIMDYSMLTMLHFPAREPPEDEIEDCESMSPSIESYGRSILTLPTPMCSSEHGSSSASTFTSGASSLCAARDSSHIALGPDYSFPSGSPFVVCDPPSKDNNSPTSSPHVSRFGRVNSIPEVSPSGSSTAVYGQDNCDSDEDDASLSTLSRATKLGAQITGLTGSTRPTRRPTTRSSSMLEPPVFRYHQPQHRFLHTPVCRVSHLIRCPRTP